MGIPPVHVCDAQNQALNSLSSASFVQRPSFITVQPGGPGARTALWPGARGWFRMWILLESETTGSETSQGAQGCAFDMTSGRASMAGADVPTATQSTCQPQASLPRLGHCAGRQGAVSLPTVRVLSEFTHHSFLPWEAFPSTDLCCFVRPSAEDNWGQLHATYTCVCTRDVSSQECIPERWSGFVGFC